MRDLLRTGAAWLTGMLTTHASQTVTYTRGVLTVQVQATLGQKLLRLEDEFGTVRFEYTDMDFLIPTEALDLGAGPVEPVRGDMITAGVGPQVDTFEVFPFA